MGELLPGGTYRTNRPVWTGLLGSRPEVGIDEAQWRMHDREPCRVRGHGRSGRPVPAGGPAAGPRDEFVRSARAPIGPHRRGGRHPVSSTTVARMARWAPDAAVRLERAALELFAEQGYDATTVPQITERAGLTTRTFFRHFVDKSEVLFLREREFPAVV